MRPKQVTACTILLVLLILPAGGRPAAANGEGFYPAKRPPPEE